MAENNLQETRPSEPITAPKKNEPKGKEKRSQTRTGEAFKKVKGSNPRQVRQQFLQHAMGADKDEAENRASGAKLRPVKDVLRRLRYDGSYEVGDYVVGFIERRAGIVEKPVSVLCSFLFLSLDGEERRGEERRGGKVYRG